jgi:hypothetical protein
MVIAVGRYSNFCRNNHTVAVYLNLVGPQEKVGDESGIEVRIRDSVDGSNCGIRHVLIGPYLWK